jgi:hypothetical protein
MFCQALRPLAPIIALMMNLRAILEEAVTPRSLTESNACAYVLRIRRGL